MAMSADTYSTPPGTRFVFRPWRRCPNTGRKIWAKNYGFKAWRIPVEDDAAI
jgi:hypothetical protein